MLGMHRHATGREGVNPTRFSTGHSGVPGCAHMVVTSRFANPADLREQLRTPANETKTETKPRTPLFDYLARSPLPVPVPTSTRQISCHLSVQQTHLTLPAVRTCLRLAVWLSTGLRRTAQDAGELRQLLAKDGQRLYACPTCVSEVRDHSAGVNCAVHPRPCLVAGACHP